MSNTSANDRRSVLDQVTGLVRPGEKVLSPVRALAFWVAVALPFLYLPLLFTGLNEPATTAAFIALLAFNAVALYVGRAHRQE